MYHTAGAIGTGGVLGLRQTGRKLITDLRAILKSFSSNLKMEGNLTGAKHFFHCGLKGFLLNYYQNQNLNEQMNPENSTSLCTDTLILRFIL